MCLARGALPPGDPGALLAMQRQSSGLLLAPCFYLEHNNMFPKYVECSTRTGLQGQLPPPLVTGGLLSRDQQGAPENYIPDGSFLFHSIKIENLF